MNPQPFEIYQARIRYKNCTDERPVIVIESVSANSISIAPLTGQMDLYKGPTHHFKIEQDDPDFLSTGLKKTCYADGNELMRIPVSALLYKRGQLSNKMEKRFAKWI